MVTLLEEWKPVLNYEGLYEASNLGQVKSLPRPRRDGKRVRGGFMKPNRDPQGRLTVRLTRDGDGKTRRVHQLVMEAFAGLPLPGQEVRHLDGNPANNHWAPGSTVEETRAAGGNLFYGTHAENMHDMAEHGTSYHANVTHCPRDHEYTPENTYIDPDGGRECRECQRINGLARYHANHVPADMSAVCAHCGEAFEREPGKPRQKFCSQECTDAGGWYARRKSWVPTAELSPEEREHRNALARVRLRRSRAGKREERQQSA